MFNNVVILLFKSTNCQTGTRPYSNAWKIKMYKK